METKILDVNESHKRQHDVYMGGVIHVIIQDQRGMVSLSFATL